MIPSELSGKEKLKWIYENKSILMTEKKSAVKQSDSFCFIPMSIISKDGTDKAIAEQLPPTEGIIKKRCIINTTNWYDSHGDVHIDGIWKENLKVNKNIYLCQEHKLTFEGIITDKLKAFTQNMSWKDLGYDIPGTTQALIFDCDIDNQRNPYMFDQYAKGYVKNHSIRMQYVSLFLAIDDEDYKEEFAVWNKYLDRIANRDEVEKAGYFWAVTEAKIAGEGSAVVVGSNSMTPVLDTKQNKSESNSTAREPEQSTQQQPQLSFADYLHKTTLVKI